MRISDWSSDVCSSDLGVIGLVASKLKERLHRPVIAFAPSEAGSTVLRGSARSIPGFHVRAALARVDATRPGLIDRFGGHAMSAGLSLPPAPFADLEAAFPEAAKRGQPRCMARVWPELQ